MIEVATGIHAVRDALEELRRIRDTVVDGGRAPEPADRRWRRPSVPAVERPAHLRQPRFKQISELYGYLAKQFTVFGQHVHIGCADGDGAIYLLHGCRATSRTSSRSRLARRSSQGADTFFESSRLNSVSAFPLSGRAPVVDRGPSSTAYFEKMRELGIVESMKDFYWDIRPKPEYGTIEVRVCDTPLTVEKAAALAAYVQALARRHADRPSDRRDDDPTSPTATTGSQACRFGMDGLSSIRPRAST